MPKVNLGQFLHPQMDYADYKEQYLASPLGMVRERVQQITAELHKAIDATTRGARAGTSQGGGQEREDALAGEAIGVIEALEWSVWVSTPDGVEGVLEMSHPPTGLRPLLMLVFCLLASCL